MATVTQWGPYFFYDNILPRAAANRSWGPDPAFNVGGTYTVTGHPATNLRNTNYSLWVSDMSISSVDLGQGDIGSVQTSLYAMFFNSGNAGKGAIRTRSAYITRVTA